MDELSALERQEALRRAQYEARHAEALRRAELVSRGLGHQPLSQRLSKSATTSPVLRDRRTLTALSDERDPVVAPDDWSSPPLSPTISTNAIDFDDKSFKSSRRLSGPAWMFAPDEQPRQRPSISQSRSSGHLVETLRHSSHPSWGHPYHQYQQYRHPGEGVARRGKHASDELHSPISSDGEHIDRIESKRIFQIHSGVPSSYGQSVEHSPPHYSSVRSTTSTEVGCTPSTSPFLGPFRTLNIHSANPSRAPSPVLLPPPATTRGYDFRDNTHSDDFMTQSRAGSVYGSPPPAGLNTRSGKTQQIQLGSRKSEGHFTMQSSFGSSTPSQIHTPVLTSGPSSNGSSPGSIGHLPSPTTLSAPFRDSHNASGAVIAPGSRPPSPQYSRGSPPSTHAFSRHHLAGGNQSTHHLTQSVRVAFGMTPILSHPSSRRSSPPPRPLVPRNTSWSAPSDFSHRVSYQQPSSGHGTPFTLGTPHGAFGSGSTPGSRAPSPPIRLPALKMLSSDDNDRNLEEGDANMDLESTRRVAEKIELPRFSELEASTRMPLSAEPIPSFSEPKMSIAFIKS